MPHVESLILIQTLVKLVWCVSLGQDTLTSLIKTHHVWVSHLPEDPVDSINGTHTPVMCAGV